MAFKAPDTQWGIYPKPDPKPSEKPIVSTIKAEKALDLMDEVRHGVHGTTAVVIRKRYELKSEVVERCNPTLVKESHNA